MNKGWYETVVWGKDSMSRRRYERKGSVGAGKALFHLSKFWLTGDVVPTVICISTLDLDVRGCDS